MKKNLWEALAVFLVFGVIGYFALRPDAAHPTVATQNPNGPTAEAKTAAITTSSANATNLVATSASVPEKILPTAAPTSVLAAAGEAHPPEITSMEPVAILENVRSAIRNYGQRFGGNPVGSNAEITRALSGENAKQINYFNAEAGMRLNDQGELIDAWGTPFFFHQLSASQMEIHSAGPDKILWTLDDLVTH
jgi:hypothetical protein